MKETHEREKQDLVFENLKIKRKLKKITLQTSELEQRNDSQEQNLLPSKIVSKKPYNLKALLKQPIKLPLVKKIGWEAGNISNYNKHSDSKKGLIYPAKAQNYPFKKRRTKSFSLSSQKQLTLKSKDWTQKRQFG